MSDGRVIERFSESDAYALIIFDGIDEDSCDILEVTIAQLRKKIRARNEEKKATEISTKAFVGWMRGRPDRRASTVEIIDAGFSGPRFMTLLNNLVAQRKIETLYDDERRETVYILSFLEG